MFGLLLRTFTIVLLGLTLAACARHKPMPDVQHIYDIRDVAVTANAGIPQSLMRGIEIRLDKAIAGTTHPTPMPRAVLNIHIVGMKKNQAYDGVRSETEVSVTLTDVPSGQALLVRSFLVYSFSINPAGAVDSAAEATASRLRVEYSLRQPTIRKTPTLEPRVSTRMVDDEKPVLAKREKSIVVPLKTAPVIGADEDPVLNSKTRVEPAKQDTATDDKAKPDAIVVKKAAEKTLEPVQAANAVEDGAKIKVVIQPKVVEPTTTEPCVETMEKKC